MTSGFDVDLDALRAARDGVSTTMRDMDSCEVTSLCGGPEIYGHAGVHAAFRYFCGRWQYGVEVLIEDCGKIVQALGGAIDTYDAVDTATAQSFTGDEASGAP